MLTHYRTINKSPFVNKLPGVESIPYIDGQETEPYTSKIAFLFYY